jgi:hypothetical protein
VTNVGEFQAALDEAAMNGRDDYVFVAPGPGGGPYFIDSTLVYAPEIDEDHGLAIGALNIYDRPVINGGTSTQIMEIRQPCDVDWSDHSARVLIADLTFELGRGRHGGLAIKRDDQPVDLINNKFMSNASTDSENGAAAVAVVTRRGRINFVNNIVSGNFGGVVGGLSLNTHGGGVTIVNNTIMNNWGRKVGGVYFHYKGDVEASRPRSESSYIHNNIVANNFSLDEVSEQDGVAIHVYFVRFDHPFIEMTHNALREGFFIGAKRHCSSDVDMTDYYLFRLGHNHSLEPRVRPDFHLEDYSPCIDRGTRDVRLPMRDYFYHPRVINGGHAPRVDLGAVEYGYLLLEGKRGYRFVPGGRDIQHDESSPIISLPIDEFIRNSDEEIGWQISIRRKSPGNFHYSLHYANSDESHYASGDCPNSGTITLPAVEVPEDGNAALEFMLFMDTDPEEDRDALEVLVDGQPAWRKTEENVRMKEWQKVRVDLSEHHGKSVPIEIVFDTITEDENHHEGVYIDQITTLSSGSADHAQ